MIPSEILKKIKAVHFKSARQVNTLMAGQYKSVFRGSGIEFEEVREYSPGDDVKSIDWKVSARLGKPFIKRYREERELIMVLLVDMSASGRFGTTEALKREIAAETAAILAFNAIRNNDKVGAILFTDRVETYIPPKKGAAHVWRLIKEIYTFEPRRTGTDIGAAAAYLGRVQTKRSVAFIISDFIAKDCTRELRTISRKHELIAAVLSDPGDWTLPEAGLVRMEDLESGRRIWIDASHGPSRTLYERRRKAAYREILDRLKRSEIDVMEIGTADTVSDVLLKYFAFRERRRR